MKRICRTILGIAVAVSPAVAKADVFINGKGALPTGVFRQASQQPDQDNPKPKPKPLPPAQEPPTPPKPQTPEEKKPQHPQQEQQPPQERKQTKEEKKQQKQNQQAQQSPQGSHGKGIKIPPQKFQAKFGREHTFGVQRLQDNRRFQYGGYWFEIVEVWPAGWGFDDLCYIDEDGDNYYLVDTLHPGYQLLIIVVEG